MADSTIANLTDGVTAISTDRLPIERSPFGAGTNRYITPGYIKTLLQPCYTVFSMSGVFNPADGLTYYQGLNGAAPITTAATFRVYFPIAGTLTDLWVNVAVGGTLGDSAQATISFRLNNTTDTDITTAASFTAASQTYSLTAQTVAIAAGDYFQIKMVCPTWATTNPTAVALTFTGWVRI